jgi:AcrR family transcriptional regulator
MCTEITGLSTINAHASAMKMKKRAYTLKKRAESQAETRQRIVEAAVELHREHGPLRTSFSMVAERAGVQRHTLYAHFPDDRALFMACSAHNLELNPRQDAQAWKTIENRDERLRVALIELYEWYGRNEKMTAGVLRDLEVSPVLQEVGKVRIAPFFKAYREVLGEKRNAKQQAMLVLALSFYTWRSLVRESGLSVKAAAEQMVQAVVRAK